MTNLILDTNIYRNLVQNKTIPQFHSELLERKKVEKEKGIVPIFSNIVAIELINRLFDSDAGDICFKSLNYLVRHTNQGTNGKINGSIVPSIFDLLTFYFFEKNSKDFEFTSNICEIAHRIGTSNDRAILNLYQPYILEVKRYKKEELNNLVIAIEENYLSPLNNNGEADWNIFENNPSLRIEFKNLNKKKNFHKLFAFGLIKTAVNEAGVDDFQIKIEEIENGVMKDFKISIDFFVKQIWEKLITVEKKEYLFNPKLDPKKRWNSFYDMQLIFATEYENYYSCNTILVTQEKRIINHFEKFNKSNLVMNLNEYENMLKK